jgi:hypothetical protein
MCFGEHFQVRIPEKLGLAFIMDLFEFHRGKDIQNSGCRNSFMMNLIPS